MRLCIIYFFAISFLLGLVARAQNKHSLSIINTDNQSIFKKLNYKKIVDSELAIKKELNNIQLALINSGYIASSIDSVKHEKSNHIAYLSIGNIYQWTKLRHQKQDAEVISKLGYGERFFTKRPFKYKELSTFLEKIVTHYENNGYPFALVKLDSLSFNDEQIQASLNIQKNIFIKLDSLIQEGNTVVKPKFLHRYLGIKDGMPYNEALFLSVSKKLKQLPFLTEKTAPVLRLTDKQNKLYLFLNKRNASQFDGIVGILPSDNEKTVFTGDVKIKLINTIFKSGETFDINWRRLQTQTQDLKALVSYPYIAGLPIGSDYAIKLYKKDTSFIDINHSLGLHYYFSGLNHIKAFYKQRNANLISVAGLSNATVLPDYADVITKSYGLAFIVEKMDYKFNPHKGFAANIQAAVGNRQIRRNPKINDLAYSNLSLKTSQYQIESQLTGYVNVYKHHVLKIATQFGSILGNTIYKNELFRIGGLRTMRGFDEESIYASTYIIPTIEYRFLFEKNSNIFLFAEGAWYENNNAQSFNDDTPMSVGAGINFETKAGIFNLSYGLGKQQGNNFDLRTGKIHAGLTALF